MKPQLCKIFVVFAGILIVLAGIPYLGQAAPPAQGPTPAQSRDAEDTYEIKLKSRQFTPDPGVELGVQTIEGERGHVILQFHTIPTQEEKTALAASGVELLNYIPDKAWFASVPANLDLNAPDMAGIRWLGQITIKDKLEPDVLSETFHSQALNDDGTINLQIVFFKDVPASVAGEILTRHNVVIQAEPGMLNDWTVTLAQPEIKPLAGEDSVQYIAQVPLPSRPASDGARAVSGVDTVQAAPYNLSGAGVRVGVWDYGEIDNHDDFQGRLTIAEAEQIGTGWFYDNHPVWVAGFLAGDGSRSQTEGGTPFQWRGMAPGAYLYSYQTSAFDFNEPEEHNSAINNQGVHISSHSWEAYPKVSGDCGTYGDYTLRSAKFDAVIRGQYGRNITIVGNAGNERRRSVCNYPSYTSIDPPWTAKNVVTVGGTNVEDDSMTDFSGWGPVDDGRVKPDVVAPACSISGGLISTFSGNVYDTMGCGNSVSAPIVSGIAALLIEQYRDTFNTTGEPLPSTIKALLIHGAKDLGNPGPDYQFGYGRINAKDSVDLIRNRAFKEDSVGHQETDTFFVDVPAGSSSLKVTLAWDDPAGTLNVNPALVNDLDVWLVSPGGVWWNSWILDPVYSSTVATRGWDWINNVEQVEIPNPESGTWTVTVGGWIVPQGPQAYSLVSESLTAGDSNTSVYLPIIMRSPIPEDKLIDLINTERSSRGLAPLTLSPLLMQVAEAHSQDMVNRNFFSHTNPDGLGPYERISNAGYNASDWGETIGGGYTTPQQAMFNGWMNSPGHRAILLDSGLTEIGIGYVTGGSYGHYWTAVFATPTP